ncbi:hypothetical protein [Actinomadura geliboluensis]
MLVDNGRNRPTKKRTLSPWQSLLVSVVVAGALAAWIIAELAPVTWLYFTGDKTTVYVESCQTVRQGRGESTHCEGEWRLPGGHYGNGRIDHAGSSTEGRRMPARATDDHATVITGPELSWRGLFGGAVIAAEIAFLIALIMKLRRDRSGLGR